MKKQLQEDSLQQNMQRKASGGLYTGVSGGESLYQNLPVKENPACVGQLRSPELPLMLHTLSQWFPSHARELEWRSNPTDYYVWVSEIMLQQTRVEAVKPYFRRFMDHFPTVKHLARAEEEYLLKCWEGLGYYSRARNLQKTAMIVVEEYGGHLPADYGKLLKLPGIGPYTAGAIASIAYGIPEPAVDGNVLRVMSRYFGSMEDITLSKTKAAYEIQLREVLRKEGLDAGLVNQSLMELGATVCVPNGQPQCQNCPLREKGCIACADNTTHLVPVKAPKKPRTIQEMTVFLVFDSEEKILIRRREKKGLLAGLYEFPNAEGHFGEEEAIQYVEEELRNDPAFAAVVSDNCLYNPLCRVVGVSQGKHIFTHIEWHMKVYEVHLSVASGVGEPAMWNGNFVTKQFLREEIALPTAFLQLLS